MMNRAIKVARFQLRDSSRAVMIFYFIMLTLAILGTVSIMRSTDNSGSMGGFGISSVIFVFILGLNCFTSSFRFMQANSVTRKCFYAGTVMALGIIAFFMATFDSVIEVILRNLIPYKSVLEQVYGTKSFFASLVFSSTLAMLAACGGWMISMLYYRSNKLQKIIVSLSPFFVILTLIYFNRRTSGHTATAILRFLGTILGFMHDANPYIASLNFIIGSMIVTAICYLLICKAPVKD